MSTTETPPKVDLQSFFNLQKKYLHGSLQKSDDTKLNKQITELQAELDTMNNVYDDTNITNADLLTKQQQVHSILDEEKKRLEKQKSVIETEYGVGPACCHEGTSFDNEQLLCVPNAELEESEETTETFQNLQPTMCNSPYEEGQYAKI